MEKIGKRKVTVIVEYVIDYTNEIGYIEDVIVKTNEPGIVHYPTILGLLDMGKAFITCVS